MICQQTKQMGWIVFSLVLLALFAGCERRERRDWKYHEVEITKQKGNAIIQAIESYHAKKGEYPTKLEDLVPDFIPLIDPPTIGTRKWKYVLLKDRDGYQLIARTEEIPGMTYLLIYESKNPSLKWHVMDL